MVNTEINHIFDNISKRVDEKGMSINALEEKAGIASGSIYKWKTVSPTIRSISKVAAVLGCSVDDLIT
ncbi:helix-turn-helix domain-containing protein [Mediterraneibacter glycyrrhizinilyticus]|uniref:helix-turn-helix domain-containing protein n=1 Tax=Mediterraneibacter glycyrrhizinilyticus TaxID=342942 RepID=UPI003B528BFB